jgi:hypothetical protein
MNRRVVVLRGAEREEEGASGSSDEAKEEVSIRSRVTDENHMSKLFTSV